MQALVTPEARRRHIDLLSGTHSGGETAQPVKGDRLTNMLSENVLEHAMVQTCTVHMPEHPPEEMFIPPCLISNTSAQMLLTALVAMLERCMCNGKGFEQWLRDEVLQSFGFLVLVFSADRAAANLLLLSLLGCACRVLFNHRVLVWTEPCGLHHSNNVLVKELRLQGFISPLFSISKCMRMRGVRESVRRNSLRVIRQRFEFLEHTAPPDHCLAQPDVRAYLQHLFLRAWFFHLDLDSPALSDAVLTFRNALGALLRQANGILSQRRIAHYCSGCCSSRAQCLEMLTDAWTVLKFGVAAVSDFVPSRWTKVNKPIVTVALGVLVHGIDPQALEACARADPDFDPEDTSASEREDDDVTKKRKRLARATKWMSKPSAALDMVSVLVVMCAFRPLLRALFLNGSQEAVARKQQSKKRKRQHPPSSGLGAASPTTHLDNVIAGCRAAQCELRSMLRDLGQCLTGLMLGYTPASMTAHDALCSLRAAVLRAGAQLYRRFDTRFRHPPYSFRRVAVAGLDENSPEVLQAASSLFSHKPCCLDRGMLAPLVGHLQTLPLPLAARTLRDVVRTWVASMETQLSRRRTGTRSASGRVGQSTAGPRISSTSRPSMSWRTTCGRSLLSAILFALLRATPQPSSGTSTSPGSNPNELAITAVRQPCDTLGRRSRRAATCLTVARFRVPRCATSCASGTH